MDPPAGESYLAALRSAPSKHAERDAPFAAQLGRAGYQRARGTPLPVRLESRLRSIGVLDELDLAATLESAVNGTSLMLMLEIAGTLFLFPGDAQWGTWQAVMQDAEWRELLKKVTFYKIGHHGSHNATPKDFVEEIIPDGIFAMASTRTRAIWPDIPRGPLLTGLAQHHAVVARSDQPPARPFTVSEGVVEIKVPL
jgi:hypothetical protein